MKNWCGSTSKPSCTAPAKWSKSCATLSERFANAAYIEAQMHKLQSEIVAKDEQQVLLFRLFRREGMTEGDLERQLAEMTGEEAALAAECQRLERELESAKDANRSLENAQSWELRRKIVEALVEGIQVGCAFDPTLPRGKNRVTTLHIAHSFEAPISREICDQSRTGKSPLRRSMLSLT